MNLLHRLIENHPKGEEQWVKIIFTDSYKKIRARHSKCIVSVPFINQITKWQDIN